MTDVSFYHLTHTSREQVVPTLLEKAIESGSRVVVLTPDIAACDTLNAYLWTYRQLSFLPHASAKDGLDPASQPIWLSTTAENPNGADIFLTLSGTYPDDMASYKKVIDVFDGNDDAAIGAARQRWKELSRQSGLSLQYYQQTDEGGWKKSR